MRIWILVVLFAIAGGISVARADVIVSGSVQTSNPANGSACMASDAAPFSLSLLCGDASGLSTQATVKGTADQYGGSLTVNAGAPEPASYATASGAVDISGNYELTGGVGMGTVTFLLEAEDFEYGDQGSVSCTLTVDGASQVCGQFGFVEGELGYDLSFTADYYVPFSVDLQVFRYAVAFNGFYTGGAPVTFSLDGPGLMLTPEPSSILLLLPGLGGVLFAARSRVRGR